MIDSHMRVDANWDTKMIEMLHSCNAGEYSVLTTYPPKYEYVELNNGKREEKLNNDALTTIRFFGTMPNGQQAGGVISLERNEDWFVRPFEQSGFAGGFVFSHGHLILNAGYSKHFDNVYAWEEPFQYYLLWKAGYTAYSPHEPVIYHNYERSYRPDFAAD